jgi:undecaprenyl-diphosphatase
MSILDAAILGLVQGLTEFLPVSSSGHLVLGQYLLHVQNPQMLSFDVYVHFGTLISVCIVFWKDIVAMVSSLWGALRTGTLKTAHETNEYVRLAAAIVIGSVPAAVIGLAFRHQIEEAFTDPKLVAVNLVITGLILFLTRFARPKEGKRIGPWLGFLIGIAQSIAIVPGISRSGCTISGGMYLRLSPSAAARFSFLLSIPVIAGASLLETKHVVEQAAQFGVLPFLVGFVVAAVTGYFAIKILLSIVDRGKFSLFAFYCFALGIVGIVFI